MKITDDFIKGICSDMVYRRGCEYFTEGRVHIKKRSDSELSAAVDGENVYNVFITFKDNKIKSEICTCQYYETMQTPCKHIVAVLKQRQTEQESGSNITNENDRIAENLCCEFASHGDRRRAHANFELFIKPNRGGEAEFEMSLFLPELGGRVQGLENFLDAYLTYRDFKVDRTNVYSRRRMYFDEHEDAIVKIMAEVYQTRSSGVDLYRKLSTKTSFGSAVVRRILPHLSCMDFKLVFDGLSINGARILKEDPDILIDVEAFGKDIVMSLSESGFALTPNGEWFFYNDVIYNTSPGWRDYFMPIYRSLIAASRTQITFRGDNAMLFAAHVLPKLKNRHGVVINGVEEIVVNTEAQFSVLLDRDGNDITAAVSVNYGNMQFRLPNDKTDPDGKIILREVDREERMLSYFGAFQLVGNFYKLSGDKEIYDFLTRTLAIINHQATVVMTDRFKSLEVRDDFDLLVKAGYKEKEDYLEVGFESEFSPEEMGDILLSLRLGEDYYRTGDGRYLKLTNSRKTSILDFLNMVGVSEKELSLGRMKLPKYELLRIEAQGDIVKEKSIVDYLDSVRNREPKIPKDLNGELRNYQVDGIAWFSQLSELGMGGILADDMGLGKTLQTLAFIHGMKPKKPSIIIAPGTLVYNWQKEIEAFLPKTKYLVITGAKEVRESLIQSINDYEFIITSYPLLRRDITLYKNVRFSYCVIDEAQFIKNRKTMNALSVKKINAEHRFALTGTPIENSILELWSIFDFIMPGYLKSAREFSERFESISDNEEVRNTLKNIIRPFVLRRMKRDVLNELPEKIETTIICDLSREQKAMYIEYAKQARELSQGLIANNEMMTILTYLLRLRQICAHPSLISPRGDVKSGKLEELLELIDEARHGGHRILVFSQFKSMLDIIGGELDKKEIEYYSINGTVPQSERVSICDSFNSGERDVILVSLKAGGTGINLTGADVVIHYDPWWNPAVTDQATDRAYRIGQKRAVNVIKLVAHGTIEEKILKLEGDKRRLAGDIIKTNENTLKSLSNDEILALFDV